MYHRVNIEKLACLRRRLAVEADKGMMSALTRLWEKETERSGMAIQMEIDKRDANLER
jgi:signal transduction histidine kinase